MKFIIRLVVTAYFRWYENGILQSDDDSDDADSSDSAMEGSPTKKRNRIADIEQRVAKKQRRARWNKQRSPLCRFILTRFLVAGRLFSYELSFSSYVYRCGSRFS